MGTLGLIVRAALAGVLLAAPALAEEPAPPAPPAPAPEPSVLDGIGNLRQLYGPRVTADDARGKVVVVFHWKAEGGRSGSAFPTLKQLQSQYGPSGRFLVMVSHLGKGSLQALEVCRQQRPNFPVFQELRLPGMEHAPGKVALLDHTGVLIAQDRPELVQPKIGAAVRAAGVRPSPMLVGVTVEHFIRYTKSLRPGQPIATSLKRIEAKADGDDDEAAEAAAISAAVRGWITAELAKAQQLTETQPARALAKLHMLARTLKGLDEADTVAELLAPLEADPNVDDLAKLQAFAEGYRASLWSSGVGLKAQQTGEKLTAKIDSYLQRDDLTDPLTAEATALRTHVAEAIVLTSK